MTDNEMLERFFQPMKEMEVEDNGFADRVMRQLPRNNVQWASRLWTAACLLVAGVLFVVLHGWESVLCGIVMMLNNFETLKIHLLLYVVTAGVLGIMALSDLMGRERRRAF